MKRRLKRAALAISVLFLSLVGFATIDGWTAFGRGATGARRARMERSAQWKDGAFENPQPIINHGWATVTGMFDETGPKQPLEPVPVEAIDPKQLASAPVSGLRITWLGHSTQLIELDGKRVLTDPIWSERASPLTWVGPTRWYPSPIPLEQLQPIDAVVISHDHYDHYDHLDQQTIVAMKDWKTVFIVPLGLGAHLEYWGVPAEKIIELDWWERTQLGELQVVCTPARHASGRTLWDKDATLWAGYALIGPKHRAWYSGDTGMFPGVKEIGEKLGPFDVTMIETGQYHCAWPDWHIGPEQALVAHQQVKGRVILPVHWALFRLAPHTWTEPIERSLAAATKEGATIVTPRPGEQFEPEAKLPADRWWPTLPWKTAAEAPIVSSQL